MKYSLIAIALIALLWPAPDACGQYGLSGSPDFLAFSAGSAGAQQPGNPYAAEPPVVAFDPAMRPISQAAPAVSAGYYGAPAPLTNAGPASPLRPPVPPPVPNAYQPGPNVYQPTPNAYQPTPNVPQPAPNIAQPAPNVYQPTLPPLSSAGQGPSLTNQMLTDPNLSNGNCWSGYGNGPALGGACAMPNTSCAAPSCATPSCDLGSCLYQPQWYASAAGLVMGRNNANRVWTTYQTNNNPNQLLNTQDAMSGWQGGYEVTLGRMFCCNCWAIEISYWWLAQMNGYAEVPERNYDSGAGAFSYSTPLSFDNMVWANPTVVPPPAGIFDFARQHRIWRHDNFQNLELNLIRHQLAPGNGPLAVDWSVGVRYFRFDEQLKVGALQQSVTGDPVHYWGEAGGQYEAYLNDSIKNSLVGFQFGLSAVYPIAQTFRFFLSPKFGIYNNHIENRFSGYRGDGLLMAPDPASGVPGSFPVSANTNALAFLTEVNLGVDWNFAPRWTAFAGYRVTWATGIGLADNQYIPYVVDIPGHRHIETNGELVLHGAFAGLTFCF